MIHAILVLVPTQTSVCKSYVPASGVHVVLEPDPLQVGFGHTPGTFKLHCSNNEWVFSSH